MTRKCEYVKCPRYGEQARVVWISQDGKTAAIRCVGYHRHSEIGSSKRGGFIARAPPRMAIIRDVSSYFQKSENRL